MELVTDNMKQAEEAYAKGQAVLRELREAKDIEPARIAEKEAEVDRWFDAADAHKTRADRALREQRMGQAFAEAKAPIRPHPMGQGEERQVATGRADSLYYKALDAYLRHGSGWRTALADKGIDGVELKALASLTDPEGGFILREDARSELITLVRDEVMIERFARIIPTNAASVTFPTANIKGSGVAAPFTVEAATTTPMNLTNVFGKAQFTPHTRRAIFQVPHELTEDPIFDVVAFVLGEIALEIAELKETDYILGTGNNQPLGLLGTTAIKNRSIVGATTAVVPEDIVDTVYDLRAVWRRNAAILMHRNMVRAVRKMRTNVGGAGTGEFMWQPGLQAGQPPTLLSYPLLESEFFTDPFAAGAVAGNAMMLVGDLRRYWIVQRLDIAVQQLLERYADQGMIGVLIRLRYDAAPTQADAFVRLNRN